MARTILGFDFGTKSIGAAVGQDLTGTASPLDALRARDGIPDWNEVGKLLRSGSLISLSWGCRSTWTARSS